MYAISNAFFKQAEVIQANRWAEGPLEIAFYNVEVALRTESHLVADLHLHEWNQSYASGHLRHATTLDAIASMIPSVAMRTNPNLIIAPRLENGVSNLHVMLASLLPDAILAQLGLERDRAFMSLSLVGLYQHPGTYPGIVETAFAKQIWQVLAPGRRNDPSYFSDDSPLRLLAGDSRFWMNRIYRLALERRETLFDAVRDEEKWKPLDEIRSELKADLPENERGQFDVRRPLMGGVIWDETDASERADVLEAAISGDGVMESLDPIIELLRSHHAHEDFSSPRT